VDPSATDVANNLAFVLATANEPDLARAMELIESALKIRPNHADYLDTRGTIYSKLGKWKEALADLEAALPAKSRDPNLHRTLAMVYQNLSNKELADEHRRLADELLKPPPEKKP
jgi:tetratricopeptide (TPR) repeat protein